MVLPAPLRRLSFLLVASVLLATDLLAAPPTSDVAHSINALGLDLYRRQIQSANGSGVLLSPYSISTALAMAYTGADGATQVEMSRVLHLPADPAASSAAFQALDHALSDVVRRSEKQVAAEKEEGGDAAPIHLSRANRLFIQKGYPLRREFTDHVAQYFASPLAELDFKDDPTGAHQIINEWVASQTRNRIPEVLPVGQPTTETRVALVNALYLKASWAQAFDEERTKDEPFHLNRTHDTPVPTMLTRRHFGYAKERGYTVVTVPYQTGKLRLVLFVPDMIDGLASLEIKLTAQQLAKCAQLPKRDVLLRLPRFKLEPATLPLGETLQALGLKTAFDQPKGSANFDRMAPRTPDAYLYIGEVFHKTWLALDEHGTEAAAATVVLMAFAAGIPSKPPPPPIEVRADRPFLFAIQHVDSGACLFLGRVTDPR